MPGGAITRHENSTARPLRPCRRLVAGSRLDERLGYAGQRLGNERRPLPARRSPPRDPCPGKYTVTSAGTTPADAVNPAVAATIAELGVDISARVPRVVTTDDLTTADIVVAMKPGLALPADPAGIYLEWSFPDPTDWTPDNVRPLREAVSARIKDAILTS